MYFCHSSVEFLRRPENGQIPGTSSGNQQPPLVPITLNATAQANNDADDILLCDLLFDLNPQSPDDCGSNGSSGSSSSSGSSGSLMSPPASKPGAAVASHAACVFSYPPPQIWQPQPQQPSQHLVPGPAMTLSKSHAYQHRQPDAAGAPGAPPTDAELMSMTIRDLNSKLRGLPRHTVQNLKRRRRTLKNRRYAQTCRQKRHSVQVEMEKSSDGLARELLILRQQLESVSKEKEFYHRRCLELEMARAKPSRLWPQQM